MDILIIGGTVFLGRHLVEAACARGHGVTLFNRGKHNPDLYPEVEKLRGDRDGDLGALAGRRWDAVVDTCGYFPRQVRSLAGRLADAVGHYTFVSSISVYADETTPGQDESAAVGVLADESVETIDGTTYGPLKALCESAAEAGLPGRVLIPRPGLIVGPHDPSDRFTYWPLRIARGGEFLSPRADLPVQVIDVRDLAEWILRMIEAGRTGIFNAVGPATPLNMGELVAACQQVSGGDARPIWADDDFLLSHEVGPFAELPLWIPVENLGLSTVDVRKAVAAGLAYRPLRDTIRATLDWAATRPPDRALRSGLAPDREADLLAALRSG